MTRRFLRQLFSRLWIRDTAVHGTLRGSSESRRPSVRPRQETEEDQTEGLSSNVVWQRGLNNFLEAVKDSYLNAEVVASHRPTLARGGLQKGLNEVSKGGFERVRAVHFQLMGTLLSGLDGGGGEKLGKNRVGPSEAANTAARGYGVGLRAGWTHSNPLPDAADNGGTCRQSRGSRNPLSTATSTITPWR